MRRRDRAQCRRDGQWPAVRTSVRAAVLLSAGGRILLACLLIWVTLGALSCAGPKKLTEQSEKALAEGEVDRAYEKARKALQKDPESERARNALRAAAERKLGGMKERVRAVAAATDTVAAARYCLDIDAFRRDLAEYRVMPAADPGFDREAAAIRHTGARTCVRRADDEMDAGQARLAYRNYELAREFESAYPGLDSRLSEAYAQALHRIAILPVANQTDARGLARELTDQLYRELPSRIRQPNFPFTVFVPRDEIYARVTMAQAEDMDKREAVEIGRDLDADFIVRSRVYALSTEANNDSWRGTVYRKTAERDTSGRSVDRYEFEIRDTRDGAVVAVHDETVGAVARVIYSSHQAAGDHREYCLVPPDLKRRDSRAAERHESDWKAHCGSWEVPAFLERARKESSRRSYSTSMRSEFFANTEERPVFLAELPPMEELALVALREAWEPVSRTIRDVER